MTSSDIVIETHAVERTFSAAERKVKALRGVSLRAPRGAFVVLMGPSGSGKTTLLNIVGGLDRPTAGHVVVAGQRLDALSGQELAELRRRIGFIFQSFALLPTASAYENVELGLRLSGRTPRAEWGTRVRRSLAAVGLTGWMHHRPYEMSGGQQQRVAIARAVAIRPEIILADEPTGDLDSKTGRQVLGLLRALCDHEGVTLLMATHDPVAAEFATDLYRLRDGLVEAYERPATAPVLNR
ncbi:MAG TPA: ABC transporter ATP-binding protein [Roseiflexaceae bacterium]|nr:ABC transporter ATP-binding protein [Roseiflexaceae bacterium]